MADSCPEHLAERAILRCPLHSTVGDYRGLWFLPHLLLRKLAIAIGLLDPSVREGPAQLCSACMQGTWNCSRCLDQQVAGSCAWLCLLPRPPHLPPNRCCTPARLSLPCQHGTGTGNTALATHAGRLLALHEGDLPYALHVACNGLVDTIGRVTFE